MTTVTVRANLPVLGIGQGETSTVEASELVETLIDNGSLELVDDDEPTIAVPPPPPPVNLGPADDDESPGDLDED